MGIIGICTIKVKHFLNMASRKMHLPKLNEVFGRNVRMRRAELGLDIATVAHLAGVNRNSITNYEKGNEPQSGKLEDLCRALEIDSQALFDPHLYRSGRPDARAVHMEEIVEGIARRVLREEICRASGCDNPETCGTAHELPDFMRRKP